MLGPTWVSRGQGLLGSRSSPQLFVPGSWGAQSSEYKIVKDVFLFPSFTVTTPLRVGEGRLTKVHRVD